MARQAALAFAAAVALLNLAVLLAAGYARAANSRLDTPSAATAPAAARIATQLQPWSSAHHALAGWSLAKTGDAAGAEAEYRTALRWAPNDPVLWSDYAVALGRLGRFDAAMLDALTRAQALGPTSGAVQHAQAELGLSYWRHGTPQLQALWLQGMQAERTTGRIKFLERVIARGQGQAFCEGPALALHEEGWCATVDTLLRHP